MLAPAKTKCQQPNAQAPNRNWVPEFQSDLLEIRLRFRAVFLVSSRRRCWNSVTQLVTVPTISRAVSRAEVAFGFTGGRIFSPFFTIRILFLSDIAIFSGFALILCFYQRNRRHTVPKFLNQERCC